MREVGALLDAKAVHGGRSAYKHLLCLAETNSIPRSRVDEVIGIVGLSNTEIAALLHISEATASSGPARVVSVLDRRSLVRLD